MEEEGDEEDEVRSRRRGGMGYGDAVSGTQSYVKGEQRSAGGRFYVGFLGMAEY